MLQFWIVCRLDSINLINHVKETSNCKAHIHIVVTDEGSYKKEQYTGIWIYEYVVPHFPFLFVSFLSPFIIQHSSRGIYMLQLVRINPIEFSFWISNRIFSILFSSFMWNIKAAFEYCGFVIYIYNVLCATWRSERISFYVCRHCTQIPGFAVDVQMQSTVTLFPNSYTFIDYRWWCVGVSYHMCE